MTIKTPHNVIENKLWQSSKRFAIPICECNGDWQQLKIKAVLNVAEEVRLHKDYRLASLRIPVQNVMNIPPEWFDLALTFYRTYGKLLVFSNTGKRRAAVFVSAIAIAEDNFNSSEADIFKNIWRGRIHHSLVDSLKRWIELRS